MPDAFWAVAKTAGQREAFAAAMLAARGVETFLPKIETRRTVQPLFASYIFCLVVEGRWLAISTCFGVHSVIKFGDAPARVPDAEIEALKARAGPNGIIALPPPPAPRLWRKGDRVTVNVAGTSFKGLHTGLSARQRETVLVAMLGAQRRVVVPSHLVHAAS
jgi:transcription antitermination factor NusG